MIVSTEKRAYAAGVQRALEKLGLEYMPTTPDEINQTRNNNYDNDRRHEPPAGLGIPPVTDSTREKMGWNLRDAKKVLQLAKPKTMKLPRGSFLRYAGLGAVPEAAGNVATQDRVLAAAKENLGADVFSQIKDVLTQQFRTTGQYAGKIIDPRKGDMARAALEDAPELRGIVRKMGPRERKMTEAIAKGHELDELAVSRKMPTLGSTEQQNAFRKAYSHASPDVLLREHNRLATLPQSHPHVRDLYQQLRQGRGEGQLSNQATGGRIGFGTPTRLSRHARRRVNDRMTELNAVAWDLPPTPGVKTSLYTSWSNEEPKLRNIGTEDQTGGQLASAPPTSNVEPASTASTSAKPTPKLLGQLSSGIDAAGGSRGRQG